MTDRAVSKWIAEWKNVSATAIKGQSLASFADSILSNEDLFQAIIQVLEEIDRFKSLYESVISTLFALYRSSERKLKLFCAQFIPSLIYAYLQQLHCQKKCVAMETLIRGVYELESSSEDDRDRGRAPAFFRLPNLHSPSVYHDPGRLFPSWMSPPDTAADLKRSTSTSSSAKSKSKTVFQIVNRPTRNLVLTEQGLRAPQRLPLCSEVWWYFNHRLPELPKHTVPTFLKIISKLVSQGFNLGGSAGAGLQRGPSSSPLRIVLSSRLLIEAVATIYFSVYNGAPTLAEQILEEVSIRANYQLWPDAIVVCDAVRNYLASSERPIQVQVNDSKKTIVTNAFFRINKHPDPDDILV